MVSTRLRHGLLGLLAAVALAGGAWAQQAAGDWHGAVTTPRGDLRAVVRIKPAATGFEGVMLSPDQSLTELPLSDIKLDGQSLSFAVARARGTFEGHWDPQLRAWAGTWSQGGQPLPLTLLPGDMPKGPVVEGLDGEWAGSLVIEGASAIRLVLRVRTGPYGSIAALDSPDQMAMGLPAQITRDGAKVGFTVKVVGLVFAGALSPDGHTIVGTTTQGGRGRDLTLAKRAKPEAAARPQTPKPPFPYSAEEVAFDSAPGVKLAGALTLPPGSGPFPAVILITGSGAQDRDETLAGHKPFAVIADDLTRRGVAVLRYDDRGFGRSTGEFNKAGIEDFAVDTAAAFAWLAKRPDIDARHIGLLGHSEGGVVAPMVAAKDSRVAFLVLVAAPAVPLREVLSAQRIALAPHMGRNAEQVRQAEVVFDHAFAAMAGAQSQADAKARAAAVFLAEGKTLGVTDQQGADTAASTMSGRWFRGLVAHDPRPFLAQIKAPVLAVTGSKDLQVLAAQNLPAMKTALSASRDVTTVELPGLNHLLQTARTGGLGEYADITETIAPAALKVIGDWIVSHVGSTAH